MKFIKANLVLVICAAVVLISVVSVFYPTMFMLDASLQGKISDDYNQVPTIKNSLEAAPIEIPGSTVTMKGPPEPEVKEAAAKTIQEMAREAKEVMRLGANANRKNYVNVSGGGGAQGTERVVPKLDNRLEFANLLPKHAPGEGPREFKIAYGEIFAPWMGLLVKGDPTSKVSGEPPTEEMVRTAFDASQKPTLVLPGQPASPADAASNAMLRKAIGDKAAEVHMYVDHNAFQVRDWLDSGDPPDEGKIFEAFVDSWLQSDVVHAIAAVNEAEFKRLQLTPVQINVGRAPVKRLQGIVVGNKAAGDHLGGDSVQGGATGTPSGDLFFRSASAAAPGGDANAASTTDTTISLTGRLSGNDYDVVLMSITVDLDPAYLNKFIDQLYRQNIGYTVLNMEMKAVDPLTAASNGYLYGQVQVYQVKLLVEGLLFRNWTAQLMPDSVKTTLGIPLVAPK